MSSFYPYPILYFKEKTKSNLPYELTINAPLILKMRDIIFFAGKLHNALIMIFRENPAKYPSLAKNPLNVYHSLYSSTEQLQVAL